MRKAMTALAMLGAIAACSKGGSQADQLDNAANQADPASATVMRDQAEAIRETGSNASLSDANGPVQGAMQNAGAAAVGSSAAPGVVAPVPRSERPTGDAGAKPHASADAMPPLQGR